MNPLFYKILLINQKLNNNKFFDKDNYDDIIKLLCNRKKIKFLRVMISDIFLFLKNEKFFIHKSQKQKQDPCGHYQRTESVSQTTISAACVEPALIVSHQIRMRLRVRIHLHLV